MTSGCIRLIHSVGARLLDWPGAEKLVGAHDVWLTVATIFCLLAVVASGTTFEVSCLVFGVVAMQQAVRVGWKVNRRSWPGRLLLTTEIVGLLAAVRFLAMKI